MSKKIWQFSQVNKEAAKQLAETCDIDPFLALLLLVRGVDSPEKAEAFFSEEKPQVDPFSFKDMDLAAERIRLAVDRGEKIAVYGDYDADGVTATAILYSYLCAMEADVMFYIPARGEGYGLNREALQAFGNSGVTLVVTVDNGITALEEAEFAASLGIDLVITDHHRPLERLPKAAAVVDAFREDCPSGCREISGAGVALKLVQALEGGEYTEELDEFIDLAMLGILADVSPVTGEARRIIRRGLRKLNHSYRPGLLKMIALCGMGGGRAITSTNAVFSLIPRINSAGRIGSADRAVDLLLTDDADRAEELARQMERDNEERGKLERAILLEAQSQIEENPALLDDRVLVLAGEGWHRGVAGIAAARLLERYGRPCVLLGIEGEEAAGSARSVEGFSIFDAIRASRGTVERFGGHTLAAGVTLKTEQIPAFRKEINRYAAQEYPDMPFPSMQLDCKLNPKALSLALAETIGALEPFGSGNPVPLFGLCGVTVKAVTPLKENRHLRLTLEKNGISFPALKFHTSKEEFPFSVGESVDLAATLETNVYRGERRLSVYVRDVRPAGADDRGIGREIRLYERLHRGEEISAEEAARILPTREECAGVYRFLRGRGEYEGSAEALLYRMGSGAPGYAKLRVILLAMRQAGLICLKERGEEIALSLRPVQGKVDLMHCEIIRRLAEKGGAAA